MGPARTSRMRPPSKGKNSRGQTSKPIVLITGAAGDIGSALVAALEGEYRLVGLDLEGKEADCDLIGVDLSTQKSVDLALRDFRGRYGDKIAAVIHLAAYFDFTGEDNPLYQTVNVEGTRHLLRALQEFKVGRFIYSGTMLVHRPGAPGLPITEETAIEPKWAYPKSKAAAEDAIREEHGDIPYVLLHLAGLYDEQTAVPTLAEQIRRIYERDPKSHAYSGSLEAGQSFIHKEDMVDAFVRTVDRREDLPADVTILVGEPDAASYQELQAQLAKLIHDEDEWTTLSVPKPLAAAGAWLEEKSEPVVPDDFDQGEKPFIRPFMIEMADDHYELDTTLAVELLGWRPKHSIGATLPKIVANLKADPLGWYEANGLTPPRWLTAAAKRTSDPEGLRTEAEEKQRREHALFLWAPFLNIGLGAWLITSPPMLGYESGWMTWSDVGSGILVILASFVALSWRFELVRWFVAAVGIWVMFAPLILWTPNAAAYLNDTLVGALIFGLAAVTRPTPGVGRVAATTGPTIPPGWDFSPSSWFQRVPIIALAFVGLYVSRYLTAYQLGHIDGVWEPFFAGSPGDPKNGTEEIITSSVSEAWPVPDAGIGALTYMLEILTGIIGSSRRWRTMPWLVVLFGIMIVPLGVVSITFIVIQPIVLGTWCTLCLIAAAAMLIQIPYSLDELVATGQFLMRRHKAGRPVLLIFFTGDTDEGKDEKVEDDFAQSPSAVVGEMVGGGVSVPWTLGVSILVGLWLMFTRLTLGASGTMANADHLIGALVITVSVTAFAEVARPVRFLNALLGMALAIMPFVAGATLAQMVSGVLCGLVLIGLGVPRGEIRHRYGNWTRHIV
ncbi:vitamin K epoxide reductase family protein [Microbaculum marinum]|uniref:Vitamin K epoxide reductase family protein n=1 Tax=Microbaculum marinum TaxID=1764581 RepID=A0AAW9RZG1_9HYPH